jgi:hypothetical protein
MRREYAPRDRRMDLARRDGDRVDKNAGETGPGAAIPPAPSATLPGAGLSPASSMAQLRLARYNDASPQVGSRPRPGRRSALVVPHLLLDGYSQTRSPQAR